MILKEMKSRMAWWEQNHNREPDKLAVGQRVRTGCFDGDEVVGTVTSLVPHKNRNGSTQVMASVDCGHHGIADYYCASWFVPIDGEKHGDAEKSV